MKEILEISGLVLNVVGAFVLIVPSLEYKIWEDDNSDDIPDNGSGKNKKEEHWFTRKGLLKNKKISLWGFGLIFMGFLLQLSSKF